MYLCDVYVNGYANTKTTYREGLLIVHMLNDKLSVKGFEKQGSLTFNSYNDLLL